MRKWRCSFVSEPLNHIHQNTKSAQLITVCKHTVALSLFSSHRKNWFAARCEYLIKNNSQRGNRHCEFFLIRYKHSQRAANQFLWWLEKRFFFGKLRFLNILFMGFLSLFVLDSGYRLMVWLLVIKVGQNHSLCLIDWSYCTVVPGRVNRCRVCLGINQNSLGQCLVACYARSLESRKGTSACLTVCKQGTSKAVWTKNNKHGKNSLPVILKISWLGKEEELC